MSNALIDETGNRYGLFTVVGRGENAKNGQARWICRCDCGQERLVAGNALRAGKALSCGCRHKLGLHRTHSMSGTRLYTIWVNMKSRCLKPNASGYSAYGGRGISVCDEWLSFEGFMEWAMSHGYNDNLTIERIDVDGNYCPSNCKWITSHEQAGNRQDSVFVTAHGKRMNIADWARELGCSPYTLYYRAKAGWTDEEIVDVGFGYKNQMYRKVRNEAQQE